MRIKFVSHASFSVESRGTMLLTDPWLCGKAFNNGWSLLSAPARVPLDAVDYFWISHQHPDHLNFPTLKSIPEPERRRITVLYQRHGSPRIPKVLNGLGYPKVQELPLHHWVRLPGGMEVMCGSVGSMDSWLALRSEGETVLNLNDCVIGKAHARYIRHLVGPDISLLFTQFSFANWIGNYADELGEAERKIREVEFRVAFFKPETTVLFASFIYFCNRENSWMNRFAVTPARVESMRLPGVVFMYPGDEWDSATRRFNSADAVRKYAADLEKLKIEPTPPAVGEPAIEETVTRMLRALHSRFGRLMIARIPAFRIYLHDVNKVATIDPRAATCNIVDATPESARQARYVMCSQVLWYAFAYSWGWGAMEVSGMYLDREHMAKGANPIAFYLNVLASEYLDFRGFAQSLRTLRFLWSKRVEIVERLCNVVAGHLRRPGAAGPSANFGFSEYQSGGKERGAA